MKCKLVFITTFIDLNCIFNLLSSISDNNKKVHVLILVIAQNGEVVNSNVYNTNFTTVVCICFNSILSLSIARNKGLEYITSNNILYEYLMFPDDDSSFDSEFFDNFLCLVTMNTLIDVYRIGTKELFKETKYEQNAVLSVKNYDAAMSVNMVIDANTISKVGFFDIKMGVGSEYGAGEDVDFFIRCCNITRTGFKYEKRLWNYHPNGSDKYKYMTLFQMIKRYKNYGRGAIYLFNKHKLYHLSLKYCLLAFGGGFIALSKFDFKLAIARFYASVIRFILFIQLLIVSNGNKKLL